MLLAIAAVALALRVHGLATPSFWGDELLALENSTGRGQAHRSLPTGIVLEPGQRLTRLAQAPPWWTVWTSLERDTHPPLHFLVLRGWRRLLGEGETGARSLSVVCSLIALLALFGAVRSWNGTEAALWASGLMALGAAQIRYAQEARNYALLLALGMIGMAALAAIERAGPTWPRLLTLGGSVLGMALTHYFAAGALLAISAYAAFDLKDATRRRVLATLAFAGTAYVVSWVPFLSLAEIGRDKNLWLYETWCLVCFAGRLLRLPAGYLGGEAAHLAKWAPFLGLVVWPGVVWLSVRRRDLRPWTFWLLGTVGALAALDVVRSSLHLWMVRYTLLAAPALFAVLGAVGAGSRSRLVRLGAPVAALLLELAFLSRATERTPDPDWRSLAAQIDRDAGPRDVLLFVSSERTWSGDIYQLALWQYLRTPRPFVILESEPTPELLRQLREAPGLWLLAPAGASLDRVPGTRVASVVRGRDVPVLARLALDPTR